MLWPDVVDPHRHADVVRWRKAERERLINDRLAISRGVWNISVPAKEAEVVVPDVVTAPVVGFDQSCYRLGYGGGFFDRTLATMRPKPRVFGVGYQQAAVANKGT